MPTTFTDNDLMPFGKHKGRRMMDVPAKYLHWLWNNGMSREYNDPVANYIRKNLHALQQEHEDGIWD